MVLAGRMSPPAQEGQGQRGRAPLLVVCGIAGSTSLRCLSGGPEFCKSCVEVPGNGAEGIGGLLPRDPRHHLVKELGYCRFCIKGLLLFVHEFVGKEVVRITLEPSERPPRKRRDWFPAVLAEC